MQHVSDGELRAYVDHELDEAERARVGGHLTRCAACQQQATQLEGRGQWVSHRLDALAPQAASTPRPAEARTRLMSNNRVKEKDPMWRTTQPSRPLWSALAVAAVLLLALTLPPVRAFATEMLGLFRVERIEVVTVDPEGLPDHLESVGQFERLVSRDVQVESYGESQSVPDAASAAALAGFPVRLPDGTSNPTLQVQQGARVSLAIDLPLMRALLQELGQDPRQLPDSLDGETVTLDIPRAVTMELGECDRAGCLMLAQLPSPTIEAPNGLDLAQLGTLYLQVMGMDAAEAQRFSQRVDWTTTLVVPLPSHHGVTHRDVEVDGVMGVLIEEPGRHGHTVLLWVRDGIVYSLVGAESSAEALELANSLR